MLVTRTLYSASGQVILAKGELLDCDNIATVLHQYNVSPPATGIHVSWKPAETGTKPGPAKDSDLELEPRLLVEGMQITRNLYSGTGMLLLTKGTLLDAGKIVSVVRYYQIDPPANGIFVARTEGAGLA
jgi:hypothetical protein